MYILLLEIELGTSANLMNIISEIEFIGFDVVDNELYNIRAELLDVESYDHTIMSLRESLAEYAGEIEHSKVYLVQHSTELF